MSAPPPIRHWPPMVVSPDYFRILAEAMLEVGVASAHFDDFAEFLNSLKSKLAYEDKDKLLETLIREELRIINADFEKIGLGVRDAE